MAAVAKLPSDILLPVFECLFRVSVKDNAGDIYSWMPLGHRSLIPAMHTCRGWRQRSCYLFYRTAVVVATSNFPTSSGHSVKSNIQLILESGYAPKTESLLVCCVGSFVQPSNILEALHQSNFSTFIWPSISTLRLYHLRDPPEPEQPELEDAAIAEINQTLDLSLPRLTRIRALSNANDSFDLFVLDDLITGKLKQLEEIQLRSQRTLLLGSLATPPFITRLTMRATAHNAAIMHLPQVVSHMLVFLDIGPLDPDNIWTSFTVGEQDATDVSKFTQLRHLRMTFAHPANNSNTRHRHHHHHHHHYHHHHHHFKPHPQYHRHRRHSRTGSNATSIITSDSGSIRKLFSHKHSKSLSDQPKPSYGEFPNLESLEVSGYLYNISQFLSESFPLFRLQWLKLRRYIQHGFSDLSLFPFTSLHTLIVEMVSSVSAANDGAGEDEGNSSGNESDGYSSCSTASDVSSLEDPEEWIPKLFGTPLPHLRVLRLQSCYHLVTSLDLPIDIGFNGLQHLTLTTGMRLLETEKILLALPHLRSLHVRATEVLSRAHEYLSRATHHKKYPKSKTPDKGGEDVSSSSEEDDEEEDAFTTTAALNRSLECLCVEFDRQNLSAKRIRRGIKKIACWLCPRLPSLLVVCVQWEYANDLKIALEAMHKKQGLHLSGHFRESLQVRTIK